LVKKRYEEKPLSIHWKGTPQAEIRGRGPGKGFLPKKPPATNAGEIIQTTVYRTIMSQTWKKRKKENEERK
jgi:hypothetical protein